MKKFTIITKDGSKWLRPTDVLSDVFNVIYIGSRPEGTVLYESEVREVRQYNVTGTWISHQFMEESHKHMGCETRIAYTDAEPPDIDYEKEMPHKEWPSTKYVARKVDAEPHDRHISDNPRYPLFQHLSEEYGLTLLDSELDEIARHAAPMTGVEYWKRRCKAAEKLMGMEPSDPKTYPEYCKLYDEWEQIIEEGRAYGN